MSVVKARNLPVVNKILDLSLVLYIERQLVCSRLKWYRPTRCFLKVVPYLGVIMLL